MRLGLIGARAMRRTLTLLVVAWLAACTHLAGLPRKPEVSLAGLRPVQLGLFEQRFALKLRVQNPGEVDLAIDGLRFTIELNGQPFLEGVSDQSLTIARFGEGVLEVMASSTLAGTLKQLRELKRAGRDSVDYRIVGRVSVVGVGSLPFERRGELSLPLFEPPPPRKAPPSAAARLRTWGRTSGAVATI